MEAKLHPQAPRTPNERSSPGDSGLEMLTSLLRQWRVFVGFVVLTPAFVLALSFLLSPGYRASTSFVPQSRSATRLPSALAGLSSQLGLSFGSDANQSPRFYATVVTGREILEQALAAR